MDLQTFVKQIIDFDKLPTVDKILIIGYYFNEIKHKEKFVAADINSGFDSLHLSKPANASSQMNAMTSGNVRRLIGNSKGFKLNSASREKVAALLPSVATPKEILVQLKKLEGQIDDPQQKTFLHETNVCFAHDAYRAAIVMAWNLAYHHVCKFIFEHHLDAYNARLPIQAKNEKPISKFADFEDARESVVIAVAKGAGVINHSTAKTLKAKLEIRNTAAHPSSNVVQSITAEEVISDLVQNIILKTPL
jgi:hypothetical protein